MQAIPKQTPTSHQEKAQRALHLPSYCDGRIIGSCHEKTLTPMEFVRIMLRQGFLKPYRFLHEQMLHMFILTLQELADNNLFVTNVENEAASDVQAAAGSDPLSNLRRASMDYLKSREVPRFIGP
jgi:hypothetical protein